MDPVNANLLNPGWSNMYCPDLDPLPVITLNTPAGITFSVNFANSRTLNGVELDGLNTVQHPAASTGANFHAAIKNGKFHGTICPTTPIGSRKIKDSVLLSNFTADPSSVLTAPAKYLGLHAPEVMNLSGPPEGLPEVAVRNRCHPRSGPDRVAEALP